MGSDTQRFTLVRKEKKVELEKLDGAIAELIVREITGKGRGIYMSLIASKVRLGPDGKPTGLKDMSGLHSKLLEMSLFDENDKAISAKEIAEYPAATTMGLFAIAKEVSGLNEDAEEEVGNDSPASD